MIDEAKEENDIVIMFSKSGNTKELLETQKNLMNTLKNMGPVLTQGKDIMNTFNKPNNAI